MPTDRARLRALVTSIALAAVAAASPVSSALAHEYWIAPGSYRAGFGDPIVIRAFAGTGFRGEPKPYSPARALRFEVHGARVRDLRPAGLNGDLVFARLVADEAAGSVVAYQSSFVPIELEASEFDRYLELEGLDGPLAARRRLGAAAGIGRERYARCAKTWIAGALGPDARRAMRAVGLPLEVVPLDDPGQPGALRVRVLYRGRPLPGVLVRAWNQPLPAGAVPRDAAARDSVGPAAEARTSPAGVAMLPIDGPGEWLVSTVHMVPCGEREVADWESLWASFTFARIPAAAFGSRSR